MVDIVFVVDSVDVNDVDIDGDDAVDMEGDDIFDIDGDDVVDIVAEMLLRLWEGWNFEKTWPTEWKSDY